MTRIFLEQPDGTLWLCSKTSGPPVPGRDYWVTYQNGPATSKHGIIGFYADSVSDAEQKLARL